jgi:hypothetical protein
MPVLYVYNKIDSLWIEELDILDQLDNVVPSKLCVRFCLLFAWHNECPEWLKPILLLFHVPINIYIYS